MRVERIITIDPGRTTGIATWYRDGSLEAAWACPSDEALEIVGGLPGVRYVETPRRAHRGIPPASIITLAVLAGRLLGPRGIEVDPGKWKGSIPKPRRAADPYIVWERCKRELAAAEIERVKMPRNKRRGWDVADAVGLGLVVLGRLDRGLR